MARVSRGWKVLAGVLLITAAVGVLRAEEVRPIHKLSRNDLQARLEGDLQAVQVHRKGIMAVSAYVRTQLDRLPEQNGSAPRLLDSRSKLTLWNAWQSFLDYQLALESLEKYHADFLRLRGTAREDSFLMGYSAMLARYRAALEFVDAVEQHPELEKVLNDAVPELGLSAGTYARLKFKYLNVHMPVEFAARDILYKTFNERRQPGLRALIEGDADAVRRTGRSRGTVLTLRNAVKVVQDGAASTWLPIQAGVAEWMGDTKVYRRKKALISGQQVKEMSSMLEPGDILLERREWYLSNIGLPGFWSHAALYIGTPKQRREFFGDPQTRAWVRSQGREDGDFEGLLEDYYPALPTASLQVLEPGEAARVIEAISEGVCFTSLEHSAHCDSLAVLRPRLGNAQKARAILRAYAYAGRPYDFDFDFATDAKLVCTELVFKAYEPIRGSAALEFPLTEVLGRSVMPANEIVKQFDTQYGTASQQFDLIIFLDGHERAGKAKPASERVFRESWTRPKWHVLLKEQE